MGNALKKVQGETLFRAAEFNLASVDEEKRTIDVAFTTGYKGRRSSWWRDEEWNEELEVSEQAMRMDRLNSGAPLLNLHQAYSLNDVLGVVVRAWIENGVGYATIRFSKREEADNVFQEVKDGILRNVSVGYNVYKWEDVTESEDKITSLRAVDWEPMEISLVPIGFDPGAQTRGHENTTKFEMQILNKAQEPTEEVRNMGDKNNENNKPATETTPDVNLDEVRSEAEKNGQAAGAAAERKRTAEIMKLTRKHGVGDEVADKLIEDGVSIDQARAQVLDHLAEKSEKTPTRIGITSGDRDDLETMTRGMQTAISMRIGDEVEEKDKELGRNYRNYSLFDMARRCLDLRGISHGHMGKYELAKRALSTSDFPKILGSSVNKSMQKAYQMAPQSFLPLCTTVENPDLKLIERVQAHDGGAFEEIVEGGPYNAKTLSEAAESYRIKKYGKAVHITLETIINDDMKVFSQLPQKIGRNAARTESDLFWAIFTGNPAMADGTALFHADHNNLGTAAAIAEASMGLGGAALQNQTDNDGNFLDLQPIYLIVPPQLRSKALQQLSSEYIPTKASDVNTYRGMMEVISEPRLGVASATNWFMAASTDQVEIIERAYLSGERGLYVEEETDFDKDVMKIKGRLFVGFKALDWRGVYKNPYAG